MQLATLCTPLYLIQIVRAQLVLGLYIVPYNLQLSAILYHSFVHSLQGMKK